MAHWRELLRGWFTGERRARLVRAERGAGLGGRSSNACILNIAQYPLASAAAVNGRLRAPHAFKPHSISTNLQSAQLEPMSRLRVEYTLLSLPARCPREKKLFEPKTHLLAAVGRSGSALCVSLTDRFGVQKIQHREPLVFSQPRPKLRRFDPT